MGDLGLGSGNKLFFFIKVQEQTDTDWSPEASLYLKGQPHAHKLFLFIPPPLESLFPRHVYRVVPSIVHSHVRQPMNHCLKEGNCPFTPLD